ncbi:hypothetical protein GBAR_LOCUS11140 [Geodia barretti]|uniref:Glyoxalase/fosfomycin resistance/dioxygenase domain-containing protein n=1 Tax=Geodia barretti TaxID=519541 RepID=A0AA35WLK1_GEOBA|nr:hypothetical protein GBAR_LOCUS11140 [Geodia barretti]
MLGPVKTVGIYVADQRKSVDFYVSILGFEVRRRMEMGGTLSGSKSPRPAPKRPS